MCMHAYISTLPGRGGAPSSASCIISLFLHTPFPSPEIWRVLPYRKALIEGMLAANVIGFHLFE